MINMYQNAQEVSGVVIPTNLFKCISDRVLKLKEEVVTFDLFSGESLTFALIEYGSFNRNMSEDERYIYLYEKAFLYDNGRDCIPPTEVLVDEEGKKYIKAEDIFPF